MVGHKSLNKEQLAIIKNTGGFQRVISGPGTGKSLTVVHYIAEIITSKKAKVDEILAVTFTNKAANELQERVLKMVGRSPDISTIHSFCTAVLRKFPPPGYSNNFTIADETGQFITISNLVKQLKIDQHPRAVKEKMNLARNLRDKTILQKEELEYFYKKYMINLQKRDIIDYDGLLTWCLYLFENNSQVLEYLRNKYKFVLVDEFQDTSPIQLAILKMLVEKNGNLLTVGDPDQSIYRFRGADVSIMVNLAQTFPKMETYYLSENYRSTRSIVEAANNLIRNNKNRVEKPLWTKREKGKEPIILSFADENGEADFVASKIEKEVKKGSQYKDFSLLYRVNTQGKEFETVFSGRGIPYQIIGGSGYYQRSEIKNMLCFFRLVSNPGDNKSFLRACSVLSQVYGRSIRSFKDNLNVSDITLIDIAYLAQEEFIRELPDFLDMLKNQKNLVAMYNLVLEKTQYLAYLKKDTSTEGEKKVENLEELKSVLVKYVDSGKGLEEFLNQVDNTREEKENNINSVKLLTIHAAKGLEFNTVFLVGAEKGMHPHFKAETDADIEEERRLFYVAVTRAQKRLFITYPKQKVYRGDKITVFPSEFIDELNIKATQKKNSEKKYFSPKNWGITYGEVN